MKPFSFDLKKFKKVASDDHSTTLQHPEGHHIVIAHSALEPKLKRQLSELPHLYRGGVGESLPSGETSPDMSDSEKEDVQERADYKKEDTDVKQEEQKQAQQQVEDEEEPAPSAPAQNVPPPPVASMQQVQQEINQPGYIQPDYKKGIQLEQQGIQQAGKAQIDLAKQQADITKNAADAQIKRAQDYQDKYQENIKEYNNFMNDYKNGHIDPNQYISDMSVPGKVSTAIGLILGGIGGGMTHQENPALKFLNAQIDRNINAQAAELGKKHNLLSANLDKFKNMNTAMEATRIQQAGIVEEQMKNALAKAGSPQAQANMNMALGKWHQDNFMNLNRFAMQQSLMNQTQGGGQIDPSLKIRAMNMAGMMSDKDKEQANKELASSSEVEKLRSDVNNQAEHLQSKLLAGALSPSDRSSAMNTFAGVLAKLSEGRFNLEESKNQMDALMPAPFDKEQTLKNKAVRREQFFDSMSNTPTLDSYGLKAKRPMKINEGAPKIGR